MRFIVFSSHIITITACLTQNFSHDTLNSSFKKHSARSTKPEKPENLALNKRKKEYLITDIGREIAAKELERLRELARTASEIMGGGT